MSIFGTSYLQFQPRLQRGVHLGYSFASSSAVCLAEAISRKS
jgi:hypothetical protein